VAECECLPKCPFFNDKMQNMPSLTSMMKKRYCLEDSSECARHIVFLVLGSEKVPADLYPSQAERAREIVSGQ
jgi:hypothetical protein